MLMLGDNYVICQQTARACLKYMAKRSNLPPSAEYLGEYESPSTKIMAEEDWKDGPTQLRILEERSRRALMKLGSRIQKGVAWKDLNMDCVAISRAHVSVYLLRTFISTIARVKDKSLSSPLTKLSNLVTPFTMFLTLVRSPYAQWCSCGTPYVRNYYTFTGPVVVRCVSLRSN
jgi:hypothetical protein